MLYPFSMAARLPFALHAAPVSCVEHLWYPPPGRAGGRGMNGRIQRAYLEKTGGSHDHVNGGETGGVLPLTSFLFILYSLFFLFRQEWAGRKRKRKEKE
jgi:hypothetical protein